MQTTFVIDIDGHSFPGHGIKEWSPQTPLFGSYNKEWCTMPTRNQTHLNYFYFYEVALTSVKTGVTIALHPHDLPTPNPQQVYGIRRANEQMGLGKEFGYPLLWDKLRTLRTQNHPRQITTEGLLDLVWKYVQEGCNFIYKGGTLERALIASLMTSGGPTPNEYFRIKTAEAIVGQRALDGATHYGLQKILQFDIDTTIHTQCALHSEDDDEARCHCPSYETTHFKKVLDDTLYTKPAPPPRFMQYLKDKREETTGLARDLLHALIATYVHRNNEKKRTSWREENNSTHDDHHNHTHSKGNQDKENKDNPRSRRNHCQNMFKRKHRRQTVPHTKYIQESSPERKNQTRSTNGMRRKLMAESDQTQDDSESPMENEDLVTRTVNPDDNTFLTFREKNVKIWFKQPIFKFSHPGSLILTKDGIKRVMNVKKHELIAQIPPHFTVNEGNLHFIFLSEKGELMRDSVPIESNGLCYRLKCILCTDVISYVGCLPIAGRLLIAGTIIIITGLAITYVRAIVKIIFETVYLSYRFGRIMLYCGKRISRTSMSLGIVTGKKIRNTTNRFEAHLEQNLRDLNPRVGSPKGPTTSHSDLNNQLLAVGKDYDCDNHMSKEWPGETGCFPIGPSHSDCTILHRDGCAHYRYFLVADYSETFRVYGLTGLRCYPKLYIEERVNNTKQAWSVVGETTSPHGIMVKALGMLDGPNPNLDEDLVVSGHPNNPQETYMTKTAAQNKPDFRFIGSIQASRGAIGGLCGAGIAKSYKPVHVVIQNDLTPRQRQELASKCMDLLSGIDYYNVAQLVAILATQTDNCLLCPWLSISSLYFVNMEFYKMAIEIEIEILEDVLKVVAEVCEGKSLKLVGYGILKDASSIVAGALIGSLGGVIGGPIGAVVGSAVGGLIGRVIGVAMVQNRQVCR
ncbi:hypothetical protein GQR58_015673 [Nymphon striatum]|nr:hypothetical protein GQR58_015673 [Nymphon striatum]